MGEDQGGGDHPLNQLWLLPKALSLNNATFALTLNTKTYRSKINKILTRNRVKPAIRLQPRLSLYFEACQKNFRNIELFQIA